MRWKLPAAILAGLACFVAIALALPILGVRVDLSVEPPQTICQPIKLSVALWNGQPMLSVGSQPTTEAGLVDRLSQSRRLCPLQSTPIYIYADRTLKFGVFTRIDDQLKRAGYKKIYLQMVDHPAA